MLLVEARCSPPAIRLYARQLTPAVADVQVLSLIPIPTVSLTPNLNCNPCGS